MNLCSALTACCFDNKPKAPAGTHREIKATGTFLKIFLSRTRVNIEIPEEMKSTFKELPARRFLTMFLILNACKSQVAIHGKKEF